MRKGKVLHAYAEGERGLTYFLGGEKKRGLFQIEDLNRKGRGLFGKGES